MKRKRYSEEQLILTLNGREAGASAVDLARMLKREGLVVTRKRKCRACSRLLACKSAPSGAGGRGGPGFRWPRRPG